MLLFRRYAAKLAYELKFWGDFENANDYAQTYEDNLRAAVGFRYRADGYLADMDGDFYSADYLRAWIRAAQLRAHLRRTIGEDWWRRPETGELLQALFAEGTRPTSEEIADRIGFRPARHGARCGGAGRRLAARAEERDRRDREPGKGGREADDRGPGAHRALHAVIIGTKSGLPEAQSK